MAKKILKRSLALGALMAFVITGSAMAETNTPVSADGDNETVTDVNIVTNNTTAIYAANGGSVVATGEKIVASSSCDKPWTVHATKTVATQNVRGGKITLGNDATKQISISANGTGTSDIAAVAAQRVSNYKLGEGPVITLNAEKVELNAYSSAGTAIGILAMNASVPGNDTTPAHVIINAKDTVITAKSDAGDYDYGEHRAVGIMAFSQGRVDINGNLLVNADTAIMTRGGAVTNINAAKDEKVIVQLNGDIDFNYENLGADNETTVNLNLTNGDSYWNGNVTAYGNADGTDGNNNQAKINQMNLVLKDGAQWTTDNGHNVINKLESDGGVVNMVGDSEEHLLEVDSLIGDTNVNVGNEKKKMVVNDSGELASLTVAPTQEYAEKIASNDMSNAVEGLVSQVTNSGGDKTLATNAYIPETAVAGEVKATIGEDGKVTQIVEATNTANAAVSDMASISMMTWRQENNDMNKRLGELRDSKGQYGAWARMARGESKYGAQSVKNQYNYYQIGYDEKLSTDPRWTVGVALTRTEGNSTFKDGSGENNHTGVAVYGSYLGENGSFIDLIAKYSRMDNEYKTTAGVGDADYKTNGYSVSAEYGKRFTKDNGLWIEPQVELTYGTVGSANYMTSKDASVRQDGIDSLVGRVGFALGKNIKAGNVYARASYLYDFDGEANVTYSKGGVTRSFEQDLGGGWWEVGIGSNINLSNATHLYFDVEKTYGGDVATPWQWNLGVRYSF